MENEIHFSKINHFSHIKNYNLENLTQGKLYALNYEESSPFIEIPFGVTIRALSIESQRTLK